MIPADSPLAETLRQQLQTDSGRTAAFDTLIADYARYHAVLVVVGGLLLIATAVAAAWCWRRFRRARRSDTASRFERRVYAGFGAFGVLLAMFLALIVAANAGNARNPEPGLAGVVGIVAAPTTPATPKSGSLAELRLAYDQWLTGSDAQLPPVVSRHIADRLAWQRPKAILSCLGLLAAAGLVALTWRTLIRRSRTPEWRRQRTDWLLLAAGVAEVALAVLLVLMVLGNTQAAIAPITLTMLYG